MGRPRYAAATKPWPTGVAQHSKVDGGGGVMVRNDDTDGTAAPAIRDERGSETDQRGGERGENEWRGKSAAPAAAASAWMALDPSAGGSVHGHAPSRRVRRGPHPFPICFLTIDGTGWVGWVLLGSPVWPIFLNEFRCRPARTMTPEMYLFSNTYTESLSEAEDVLRSNTCTVALGSLNCRTHRS